MPGKGCQGTPGTESAPNSKELHVQGGGLEQTNQGLATLGVAKLPALACQGQEIPKSCRLWPARAKKSQRVPVSVWLSLFFCLSASLSPSIYIGVFLSLPFPCFVFVAVLVLQQLCYALDAVAVAVGVIVLLVCLADLNTCLYMMRTYDHECVVLVADFVAVITWSVMFCRCCHCMSLHSSISASCSYDACATVFMQASHLNHCCRQLEFPINAYRSQQ